MKPEIEVKAFIFNPSMLQQDLDELGLRMTQSRTLFKRQTFEIKCIHPDIARGRVRQEGENLVTMTIKRVINSSVSGTLESELVVANFEEACSFLEAAGLVRKSYQENYRTTWKNGDMMVTLDEWPGLTHYLEIEGPTEAKVYAYAHGFRWSAHWDDLVIGTPADMYLKALGIPKDVIWNLPEITFANPPKAP
jgi:adenylate cyclase class IV